jgi:hypothetical protein
MLRFACAQQQFRTVQNKRANAQARDMKPTSAAGYRSGAIVVHSIAEARAALATARALGVPVLLVSPPSGAASLGAGWWEALVRRLAAEYPDVQFTALLDCGSRADLVQSAMRQGLTDVVFRGPAATGRRLDEIAVQGGARLHRRLPPALDLAGVADPVGACRAWLSKTGRRPGAG